MLLNWLHGFLALNLQTYSDTISKHSYPPNPTNIQFLKYNLSKCVYFSSFWKAKFMSAPQRQILLHIFS